MSILRLPLFLLMLLLPFAHAMAEESAAPVAPDAFSYFDGTSTVTCPSSDQKIVLARVTNCVQAAIVQATTRFLQEFSDYMQPIIAVFLVLVVTFFGVKLLWGEGEVKKKAFALLLKIGVVLMFSYNLGGFAMQVFGASGQLQNVIVHTLQPADPADAEKCDSTGFTASSPTTYISTDGIEVWASLDCLLGRLFGYGKNFGLPASIFGLMGSILGSGTIGVSVFFLGIAAFLSIIFMVFRAIYIFLTAYLMLGFLMVISPLIVPLLLLRATTPAFESWIKNIMAGIALPGLVFAYLCIAIPVLEEAIQGTDDTSLMKVLGSKEQIESRYRNSSQRCSMPMSSFDRNFTRARGDDIKMDEWYKGNLRNILNPTQTAAADFCSQLSFPSTDFGAGQMGELWKIGYSLLRLAVVAYMLSKMMNSIPTIVTTIFAGAWSLGEAAGSPMPLEGRMKAAFAGSQKGASTGGFGGGLRGLMQGM